MANGAMDRPPVRPTQGDEKRRVGRRRVRREGAALPYAYVSNYPVEGKLVNKVDDLGVP